MIELTVRVEVLAQLIRRNMCGSEEVPPAVVWRDRGSELLLLPEHLEVGIKPGWLQVRVITETVEFGTAPLGVVFFLGGRDEGGGTHAGTAVADEGPQELAERWGPALQDVVWNAVLDVVEAAVARVAEEGAPVTLIGFGANDASLYVDVDGGT